MTSASEIEEVGIDCDGDSYIARTPSKESGGVSRMYESTPNGACASKQA